MPLARHICTAADPAISGLPDKEIKEDTLNGNNQKPGWTGREYDGILC
jgi:hypothetical protein